MVGVVRDLVIVSGVAVGIYAVYLLSTRTCWACRERLSRRTLVCFHCGRWQRPEQAP